MMTGTMARIAARGARKSMFLAPLLAAMLLTSGAMAEEQPEDLVLADGEDLAALDSDALDENTGGFVVQQVSNVDQDTNFSDNPVTVDNGGQINTGGILSANMNSGGITTTMLNTGNNVSFQNSTTLNIYLDGAQ